MSKIRKIATLLAATLLALSITACRQAAPAPEPTTTGGTDKLPIYYATMATLPDVVSSLTSNSTIIMLEQVTANDIPTIRNLIHRSNQPYKISLDLTLVTGLTSIPRDAFRNSDSLINIILPETVSSIEDGAFSGCYFLNNIIIPDNVISIGKSAFDDCYSFSTITIPASVTSIGEDAFYPCGSLATINVAPNNPNYSNDQNGVLFNKNKTVLIRCPQAREDAYTIPDSVTTVSKHAFASCQRLTGITIPVSVSSIGEAAFYSCKNLSTLVIPSSITEINKEVFFGCSGLTSVTFPNNLKTIGEEAFSGCSSLPEISIPATVTDIDEEAFSACNSFTTVFIPSSVTSIGENAFLWCSNLTAITVDSNNRDYSNDANGVLFNKNKTTLIKCPETKTSYTIPDTVTGIEESAFHNCKNLTELTIPSSVIGIGRYAFYNCSSLTSITIPASVTSIEYYAFKDCTSLTSISFADPNNWYTKMDENSSTESIPIDLSDPSTNVTYFESTYDWYYWYKASN